MIILLDSTNHEAHLFGAGPCCSGGTVYTKNAPLGTLAFPAGIGTPFIKSSQDPKINNVTSTKQTRQQHHRACWSLAGDDSTRFYVHNFLTIRGGDTTAPTVTTVSPADKATGQARDGATSPPRSRRRWTRPASTPPRSPSEGRHGATGRRRHTRRRGDHRHAEPDGQPQGRHVLHRPHQRSQGPRRQHRRREELDLHHRGRLDDHRHALATADTYVNGSSPGTTYGHRTTVWVDNSPVNIGYLKFNLAPYAGRTITAATLKVRTTTSTASGSGGTFTVRPVTDDTWSESTTYTTRKALGSTTLGSLAKPTATQRAVLSRPQPRTALQGDVGIHPVPRA